MFSILFHRILPSVATWPHRLIDGTTSAAVISLPWWNRTPRRRVIVWRRPPSPTSCDSASSGIGLNAGSYVNSDSKTCHMISYVITVVDIWISSVGGSPTVATLRTPPTRGVSWARTWALASKTMMIEARTSALFMVKLSRGMGERPTGAVAATQDPLSEAAHRRFRVLQPGTHVHRAVHRRGGREVFSGFLTLAQPSVELPEAEVAVGDERAHAQFVGEGHSLLVGGFSLLGDRRLLMLGIGQRLLIEY